MFEVPEVSAWQFAFAAMGAAVLWARWGQRRELRIVFLEEGINVLPVSRSWKRAIGMLLFITVGGYIGAAIYDPTTAMQALTAGFAWTAVFTDHPKPS